MIELATSGPEDDIQLQAMLNERNPVVNAQERMRSLTEQCRICNLPIETIQAARLSHSKLWKSKAEEGVRPELIVLSHCQEEGYSGCWCEGGTLKLLMKAAGFPVLVKYNFFHDRGDARTRFFEAQCTILKDHLRELVDRIATAPLEEIADAAEEILGEHTVREFFPRVNREFLLQLGKVLGSELLAKIAQIFVTQPYDFRAGWPDLTLLKDSAVRFVEVKTTDLLRTEQIRIIENFSKPLGLDFAIAHLVASPSPRTANG